MKIIRALIALLAGTVATSVGAATPSEQAFRSETQKFRDWTAICDNTNNSVAYAPAEGDGGYVMIKMEGDEAPMPVKRVSPIRIRAGRLPSGPYDLGT